MANSYQDRIIDVIKDLYNKTGKFPTQKVHLCREILELAKKAKIDTSSIKWIMDIAHTRVDNENRKNSKSSDRKIAFKDVTPKEVRNDIDAVNAAYYKKVIKIVDRMNNELGSNANDIEKLKWLYDYLLDIPFDFDYHKYQSEVPGTTRVLSPIMKIREMKDTFSPVEARVNSIPGHPNYKFGIFDKENLLLADKKTGVCQAFAGLLVDLCNFAKLDNNLCLSVAGKHCGEGHAWNAILNMQGIFMTDTSHLWESKNGRYSQFMVPFDKFKTDRQFKDYKLETEVVHSYRENKKQVIHLEPRRVPPKNITINKISLRLEPSEKSKRR